MFKKVFLKGSIFVIILTLIVLTLGSIFAVKTNTSAKIVQGLYNSKGDTFDVVLLGSSHMNDLINPNILWKQYGITSFNYATGGQTIDVTYYLLKEILKKHKNPIVVVDLYYLGSTDKYGNEGYVRTVLDNLKFSVNKIVATLNCTPRNQWSNYLISIFKYHDRWKELSEKDLKVDTLKTYYQKGFDSSQDVYGKENTSEFTTTGTVDLQPRSEEYLNKIIALSKKDNFKLIFTNAPHDYKATVHLNYWEKQPSKMFNKIAEISKKNNIPFINYNTMIDELGFDFKTDMKNIGHLNVFGANKVTLNLGEFLKENYKLVDHRNDVKYKKWDSDYSYYSSVNAANAINKEVNIKKYASLIKDKNYIVVASSNDAIFSKDIELKKALSTLGLKFDVKNTNFSNYLAVINDNKVLSEIMSTSKISKNFVVNKNINLKVITKSDDKKMPSIVANGLECSNKHNGLSIMVYDKVLKKVIDKIYLDPNNELKRQ